MPLPAPSGASSARRPKVIYVMGAGRSGSSILGVALGNCDGIFFAGELDKWLQRRGTPTYPTPERERFWGEIRAQLPDASDLAGAAARSIDRSSGLFDPRAWRTRRRVRERYRRLAEDLYLALAAATGAGHVVDTSHYPLRARELQALERVDLYLLLLVRDPQAVVASLAREDVRERRFGTLAANAYLLLTDLLSVSVFLRHPRQRRLLVRHEEVLAEPERVLRRILEHVGSDAPTPDLTALATGLPIHANRLVGSPTVALERGAEQIATRSWLTKALQLPAAAILSRLHPSTQT